MKRPLAALLMAMALPFAALAQNTTGPGAVAVPAAPSAVATPATPVVAPAPTPVPTITTTTTTTPGEKIVAEKKAKPPEPDCQATRDHYCHINFRDKTGELRTCLSDGQGRLACTIHGNRPPILPENVTCFTQGNETKCYDRSKDESGCTTDRTGFHCNGTPLARYPGPVRDMLTPTP